MLLALAAMLIAVLALGLLLAPRPPADDYSEAGFASDMATHHDQAVRMAELALQRTNDPEIRVLATFLPPPGSAGPVEVDAIRLATQAVQLAVAVGCQVLWVGTATRQVRGRRTS